MPLDMKRTTELAGRAIRDVQSSINGKSKSPDLDLYESLDTQDFEALKGRYGEDQVMEYVKQMEAKRLGAR